MAEADVVWKVCQNVLIQNYLEHHIVVRLANELFEQVSSVERYYFVGITNFLLKKQNFGGPNFEPGDCLSVYYKVAETLEKKLLLTFDLYTCNHYRIQHFETTNSTNYRMLFAGSRNVTFVFETNIGANRLFCPFECDFEAIIQPENLP